MTEKEKDFVRTLEKIANTLNNYAESIGDTITEYHWRELCELERELRIQMGRNFGPQFAERFADQIDPVVEI